MSKVRDRFDQPIANGDYVLCKMSTGYNGNSRLNVGRISKLNNSRHEVQPCNDDGSILTYSGRNGVPYNARIKLIDRHNMAKIDIDKEKGTVKLIKKMTL